MISKAKSPVRSTATRRVPLLALWRHAASVHARGQKGPPRTEPLAQWSSAPPGLGATEDLAQFVLCRVQRFLAARRQRLAGAVDVEIQHRHGRLKGAGLAPLAVLGRTFERSCDALGIFRREGPVLEVQRVALPHDVCGPVLLACGFRRGFRFGRHREPRSFRRGQLEASPETSRKPTASGSPWSQGSGTRGRPGGFRGMPNDRVSHTPRRSRTAADLIPENPTLAQLRRLAADCTACPLYARATQTVFGEGPERAVIMLVG